jgi:hypothetical protein
MGTCLRMDWAARDTAAQSADTVWPPRYAELLQNAFPHAKETGMEHWLW